jgi:hypothetical protein
MRWVFWQSSRMVGMGIVLGLVGAATFSRALSAFLFGLSCHERLPPNVTQKMIDSQRADDDLSPVRVRAA